MTQSLYQAPLGTMPNNKLTHSHSTYKSILSEARGRWKHILISNGIHEIFLKNKHGACPICGGKDRFRFDDKEGEGTFICNKCGAGNGFKLLQLYCGWDFFYTLSRLSEMLSRPLNNSNVIGNKSFSHPVKSFDIQKRKQSLNAAWQAARAITKNDPVDCYLRNRGIFLNNYPSVLRFHPNLPYYDDQRTLVGYFQAMIALVQDKNNAGVTIHRTYLENGYKANVSKPKKLMAPIQPGATKGAAIKLFAPIDGKLAVAEGIETALAFYMATQMSTWAAISAYGMEKVLVPDSVKDIVILVDNDISGTGQASAAILTQRLLKEGKQVRRIMPATLGHDFNNLLLEGGL